ncbi:MAG: 4Fe-4S binding protein [bacterium]|nr:4Fe-4S binding protein [bacterium]
MAHVVTEKCLQCGSCSEVCPVEAIHGGDTQFFINPNECIDCGACMSQCPAEAIYPEDELPEEYKDAAEKNKEFYA